MTEIVPRADSDAFDDYLVLTTALGIDYRRVLGTVGADGPTRPVQRDRPYDVPLGDLRAALRQ